MNKLLTIKTLLISANDQLLACLSGFIENLVAVDNATTFIEQFDIHQPQLVIFACETLMDAQTLYLDLNRNSTKINQHKFETLIVCKKEEEKDAQELCMRNIFDSCLCVQLPLEQQQFMFFMKQLDKMLQAQAESHQLKSKLSTIEDMVNDLKIKQDNLPISQLQELYTDFCNSVRNELTGETTKEMPETTLVKQDSETEVKQAVEYDTSAKTILFVDDDPMFMKVMAKMLDKEGYNVLMAGDYREANQYVQKTQPDIMIVDYEMPEVNGVEMITKIKKHKHLQNVPIIMLTGHSEKDIVHDAVKVGVSDFIVKPSDKDTILRKINQCLVGNK